VAHSPLSDDLIRQTLDVLHKHGDMVSPTARAMGVTRSCIQHRLRVAKDRGLYEPPTHSRVIRTQLPDGSVEVSTMPQVKTGAIRAYFTDDKGLRHYGYSNETDLRAAANIPDDYSTSSISPNSWPAQDSEGVFIAHQVKACFKPPDPREKRLQSLLEGLGAKSPVVELRDYTPSDLMLEISIMDPHVGLRCYAGGSDADYSPDIACDLYRWAVRTMVQSASIYGEISQILLPVGNDFLHVDGVYHTTTKGTPQPEADSWHYSYQVAEGLLIGEIDYLSTVAPVQVLEIPGNHDRQSSFTLGRVLNAWYRNDENVTVDCSVSPYKFYQWGCTLLGFEHGNSIAPVRLAAIMANEAPHQWAATAGGYREWHLGDQHRKGSAKPSAMEEQGVAIEYLPSLVAGNEWHKLKGFNHQQRGAVGFVWSKSHGPVARLSLNLSTFF